MWGGGGVYEAIFVISNFFISRRIEYPSNYFIVVKIFNCLLIVIIKTLDIKLL